MIMKKACHKIVIVIISIFPFLRLSIKLHYRNDQMNERQRVIITCQCETIIISFGYQNDVAQIIFTMCTICKQKLFFTRV